MLEAFELYRFYHAEEAETFALRGVSLRLDAGEIVAVMGPSGSGKSTLLACLSGLDEPDGGHVEVMGQRLTRRSEAVRAFLRARHIGILLQTGNLFEHLSVTENIRLQMLLADKPDAGRLEYLLGNLGLQRLRDTLPAQLSGGDTTRAALGVSLAAVPDVLLTDEPTAEVDIETEGRILELLARRRQQNKATLIATHSTAIADGADRILTMRDGRIVDG